MALQQPLTKHDTCGRSRYLDKCFLYLLTLALCAVTWPAWWRDKEKAEGGFHIILCRPSPCRGSPDTIEKHDFSDLKREKDLSEVCSKNISVSVRKTKLKGKEINSFLEEIGSDSCVENLRSSTSINWDLRLLCCKWDLRLLRCNWEYYAMPLSHSLNLH